MIFNQLQYPYPMLWPFLGSLFFLTILFTLFVLITLFIKAFKRKEILITYTIWMTLYLSFIIFFTGPEDLSVYPPHAQSPYKLPWEAGVSRLVGQGNRSFTSHRDLHIYAWDFVMMNGTEILAARSGRVVEVKDDLDGIGLNSNFILIEHEDGQKSGYAHIQYHSSKVKVTDLVKQGQPIALSGMVGQTIYPHLHFYVLNSAGTASVPISFQEVADVPRAGRFYSSGNKSAGY